MENNSSKGSKKVFFVGLLAGLLMLVVSVLFSMLLQIILPSVQVEYYNSYIFRPWSDPLMSLIFVVPFLLGIILAMLWNKHKAMLPGKTQFSKVMKIMMLYFTFSLLGMIISYSTFQISLLMTATWVVSGFLQLLAGAWIFAKMIKN